MASVGTGRLKEQDVVEIKAVGNSPFTINICHVLKVQKCKSKQCTALPQASTITAFMSLESS